MKILTLSLLRIGDFFQQVHLLRKVEADLSPAEIHIVAFDEAKAAAALFPSWRFHFIPRLELQRDLIEKDRPWYRALALFEQTLSEVLSTEWDLILNPTHTSFSARLMDCFSGHEKRGVRFEMGHTEGWNQELRFLNDHYRSQKKPDSTWIELTSKALGFELSPPSAERKIVGSEIWLNPLTSDHRKNWPLKYWQRLADMLVTTGHQVRILGAPGESSWVQTQFPTFPSGAWSFAEMSSKVRDCALTVSGDTSVPHFLALHQVPLLTLFLGPANPFKTPPRALNSWLMGVDLECAPCEHRGACTLPSRICDQAITVREVYQKVLNLVGRSNEQTGYSESPRDRIAPMVGAT